VARLALRTAIATAGLLLAAGVHAAERPRVGLVLGGGGARGGAHLGVLEVLEQLHVPVDCIAGTSMGALVGGAYATGVPPAEIEDLVRRTDWIRIFDDSAGREAVDIRRKEMDDRFYSALELGVSRHGLEFREGALAGEKLKLFFNQLVRSDLGDREIEQLRMPLAIMATDIGTGERVAIRSGSLTSAMRGSMSVPGLLEPVSREGRKLVDGGLTDNLPVAEVRALCHPDVLIVVNVGSPLLKPEQVKGIGTVLGQVVNLLTEQNVEASLKRLQPGDVYIQPDLGNIGATEFTRQLEAADKGRAAAQAMTAELQRLAAPPEQYAAWQQQLRLAEPPAAPVIDQVEVAHTRFVNPETIRSGIRQEEGQPLDSTKLAADLVREFSQGDLNSLDYSVATQRDRTILRITPVEKPWGPGYLRFGLNLASDFRSESDYNLRALYRRTWVNRYGGELLVGGQIGSEQNITTEFFQPVDLRHIFFVRPYAGTGLRKMPIYQGVDRLAVYRVQDTRGGLGLGANLGVDAQASVGWVERRLGAVLDTGPDSFLNLTQTVGGPTARVSLDTYDQPFFPRRGMRLDATYFDARRATQADKYSRAEARWGGAFSYGRWSYLAGLEGGDTRGGQVPLGDAFTLGGPRRLSGFANEQLLGGRYTFGRVEAQYRLQYASPLWGLTLIGGVAAETGRMDKPLVPDSLMGWQHSLSAYLAANTFLGPVYFGVADAKHGRGRFYLFIGTP
jgi:NTE family protein